MPMRVVQMPDLDAVARAAVKAAVRGVEDGLKLMQNEAAQILRRERHATGHLSQSLHTEILPQQNGRIMGMMGPSEPYGPWVEYDTRPHVAPFAPFLPWATRKGWNATGKSWRSGSKEQLEVARSGWLAVKRRGTKGIHYLRRAFQRHESDVARLVQQYVGEAVRRYAR